MRKCRGCKASTTRYRCQSCARKHADQQAKRDEERIATAGATGTCFDCGQPCKGFRCDDHRLRAIFAQNRRRHPQTSARGAA
jgi:hypothetical protein